MKITETKISGIYVIEPKVFNDERGFFMETYNKNDWLTAGLPDVDFVQDNHSKSSKGVLRGLHFQEPQAQGKLVRVISGAVFDVVVDIRKNSSTFGQWFGLELSSKNKKQLWIPAGFAHGFLTLEDDTEFVYKCTDYYASRFENTLLWNDPFVDISWPNLEIDYCLSEKDLRGSFLVKSEQLTIPLET